jgi:hypothetical protein
MTVIGIVNNRTIICTAAGNRTADVRMRKDRQLQHAAVVVTDEV